MLNRCREDDDTRLSFDAIKKQNYTPLKGFAYLESCQNCVLFSWDAVYFDNSKWFQDNTKFSVICWNKKNVNILHPSFKNVSLHFWVTWSFIRTGKISSSLCLYNTHKLSSIAHNRAVNGQKLILSFMKSFIVLYL